MQLTRRLFPVALAALLAAPLAVGCGVEEPDRLVLKVLPAEGGLRAASLLIYVRDDGPPRAVGAGVYPLPPDDAGGQGATLSIRPDTALKGDVAIYVVACGDTATCGTATPSAPDCTCAFPVAMGAAVTHISGRTRVEVRLGGYDAGCDRDGDLVVDCGARADCCASLAADARAAVSDCADAPVPETCAPNDPVCGARLAHPFRPTEPTSAEAEATPELRPRNALFCEDGLDNDCAGEADSLCAAIDADGDHYTPPADCDDTRAFVNPGVAEDCDNNLDDDCDGVVARCDHDRDGATGPNDCDDDDPTRHNGAADPCGDGIDQDCDGIDLPCISDDVDGDGVSCKGQAPGGEHRCPPAADADCDDLDAAIFPGAPEPCFDPTVGSDGVDRNCDGLPPQACPDDDQDGDGNRSIEKGGGDCDDHDPAVHPGAAEPCRTDAAAAGDDRDCDGIVPLCAQVQDEDGDGWPSEDDCDDKNAAVHPEGAELCNGIDDDCDGVADEENPLVTAQGAPPAADRCGDDCPGAQPCGCYSAHNVCTADLADPERKTIFCLGIPRGRFAEVCNGSDDDCDGTLDNVGAQLLRIDCYDGPAGTEDVGNCHGGYAECASAPGSQMTVWGACQMQSTPNVEVCDAIDNDCDGARNEDEGGRPLVQSCSDFGPHGGVGPCVMGTQTCGDRTWGECTGDVGPSPETCNGVDDNCDRQVDFSDRGVPLEVPCYEGPPGTSGVGVCRDGRRQCLGGEFRGCEDQTVPSAETCDDRDEDCDGQTDEDLHQRCGSSNVGACHYGQRTCARGRFGDCVGAQEPVAETCNGVDDDCDGTADNLMPVRCGSRVGQCMEGLRSCRNAAWSACEGEVAPVAESCDGLDNDCDGTRDNGFPVGQPCEVGVGACHRAGMQVCAGDGRSAVCNVMPGVPSAEICNRVDDDCDGDVDNVDGLGVPCMAGQGPCQRTGQTICGANGVVCSVQAAPASPEICNGIDDNCDGQVDNAPVDAGAACTDGLGPCMDTGTFVCQGGRLSCTAMARMPAGPERCNGIDDDCNGQVDDGGGLCVNGSCQNGECR